MQCWMSSLSEHDMHNNIIMEDIAPQLEKYWFILNYNFMQSTFLTGS